MAKSTAKRIELYAYYGLCVGVGVSFALLSAVASILHVFPVAIGSLVIAVLMAMGAFLISDVIKLGEFQ